MMDSNKLRMLMKAVEAGSMMKVAEENGYTASGLTHMMTALERELGIKILYRNSRGVSLNSDGQRLLPLLKRYLTAEDKIYKEIEHIKTCSNFCIRIASYPSIAKVWLPGIMKGFLSEHPDIDIDLVTMVRPDAYQALDEGAVDIIFAGENASENFDFILLKEDPYYLIFPPEWTDEFRDQHVPLERLAEYRFIMPAYRADTEIKEILARRNITPAALDITADYHVIVNMVLKGLGVSIVSGLTLAGSFQNVPHVPLFPNLCRKLGIAVRHKKKLSPIVKEFIDFASKQSF